MSPKWMRPSGTEKEFGRRPYVSGKEKGYTDMMKETTDKATLDERPFHLSEFKKPYRADNFFHMEHAHSPSQAEMGAGEGPSDASCTELPLKWSTVVSTKSIAPGAIGYVGVINNVGKVRWRLKHYDLDPTHIYALTREYDWFETESGYQYTYWPSDVSLSPRDFVPGAPRVEYTNVDGSIVYTYGADKKYCALTVTPDAYGFFIIRATDNRGRWIEKTITVAYDALWTMNIGMYMPDPGGMFPRVLYYKIQDLKEGTIQPYRGHREETERTYETDRKMWSRVYNTLIEGSGMPSTPSYEGQIWTLTYQSKAYAEYIPEWPTVVWSKLLKTSEFSLNYIGILIPAHYDGGGYWHDDEYSWQFQSITGTLLQDIYSHHGITIGNTIIYVAEWEIYDSPDTAHSYAHETDTFYTAYHYTDPMTDDVLITLPNDYKVDIYITWSTPNWPTVLTSSYVPYTGNGTQWIGETYRHEDYGYFTYGETYINSVSDKYRIAGKENDEAFDLSFKASELDARVTQLHSESRSRVFYLIEAEH